MKINYFVELMGKRVGCKDLSDTVKDIWKAEGNPSKNLKSMEIYYKPEEKMCYYVINGENQGGFQTT
ncbi:MAG: DUF6465 family protein [Defluviitaleaceae bacterium]|nr:DUF6465 family protein [Defluviitaleaceae bacterium]